MNSTSANAYKGTILIADNTPDDLHILSASLDAFGYKTHCVTSGEMALVSVESCPPDLILLDIQIPVLDGYEVCQRLKSNPKTQDIPIIFLSALDNVLDKVKAFEIGGVDYVTKPFQPDEILARIASQLTIHRLQNQLVSQNQALQQEIESHKRTEVALQDAKESAEIANRVKSNFMDRMSHELRTPLNTILGFSSLMIEDPSLTKEHQDYLARIQTNAQNLLKMINQAIAITREESAQITLNIQNFDLHSLLRDLLRCWRPQADSKGLQVDLIIDPNLPNYMCSDDGKLRQILDQLLKNVIQFTESGCIKLKVSLESGDWTSLSSLNMPQSFHQETDEIIFFNIEETGCGTDDHQESQLFHAFSHTQSRHQAKHSLGLGLYISHQYIQALGGQISLASTPGQGARVRFYLPSQLVIESSNSQADQDLTNQGELDETVLTGSNLSLAAAETLMVEALDQDLPLTWVLALHKAAMQGSDHQVTTLVQQIPETYWPLARVISDWNKNFQFDLILAISQRAVDRSHSDHSQ